MDMEQGCRLWKIEINSNSGISKTIFHNCSYLLLFGKTIFQSLKASCE